MNVTRTRKAALGAVALSLCLFGAAGAANAASATQVAGAAKAPVAGTSGPEIHFWTEGLAKPGAELDVYAECGQNKNGKVVTDAKLSGVASGVMTPGADKTPGADNPYLVGTITLPKDFSKPTALNLSCDNGATATTVIVPGETESTADGLIPSLESEGYESAGMGEDEPYESAGMGEEEAPSDFWDGDGYLVPDDCDGGDCTGPIATGTATETATKQRSAAPARSHQLSLDARVHRARSNASGGGGSGAGACRPQPAPAGSVETLIVT